MILTNNWVGYLDRTQNQIKARLVNNLQDNASEITDLSDGNPFILILDHVAGISEVLHSYLDRMGREPFLEVCRKWISAFRLATSYDYPIQLSRPASVELTLDFKDNSGNPIATTADFILPSGTKFKTASGVIFTLPNDIYITQGSIKTIAKVQQYEAVGNFLLGYTQALANFSIVLGNNIVRKSVNLTIGSDIWTEVDTFAFSNPTSKHFKVSLDQNREARIYFGDGVFGQIPPNAGAITVNFRVTNGASSNLLLENTVNEFVVPINIPGVSNIQISHILKPNGGSNYETLAQVKKRLPLTLRSLWRFVSYQDGADLANGYPGVFDSKVDFCCNRDSDIKVYVAPEGGGIPSLQLRDEVRVYLECIQVIGMPDVQVLPSGLSKWVLSIEAKAKYNQDPALCLQDIKEALLAFGRYENSYINRPIRISEIYGVINQLPRIQYSNRINLYTIPYPRPLNHETQLNWIFTTTQEVEDQNWVIQMSQAGPRIFRNNQYLGTISLGQNFVDPVTGISFIILPGAYSVGLKWEFRTIPTMNDQIITDYSVPVIDEDLLFINVEPADGSNCKPCCTC